MTSPHPAARAPRARRTNERPDVNAQESSAYARTSVPMVGTWVSTVTESGVYAGLVIRSDDFMGATAQSPAGELFAIEPGQSWVRVPR